MPAPKKNDAIQQATFSPTVAGAVGGIAAFSVVFILLPGLGGAALGLAAGVLGFFGLKTLLTPDPMIGGVAVDSIKNGDKIKERLDAAMVFQQTLTAYEAKVRDQAVKQEIRELESDFRKLIQYVESNPDKWSSLTHWMNTFSDTAISVLENYSQQEGLNAVEAARAAKPQVLKSLNVLEGAAQGELANAMKGNAITLEADAAALEQLARQDGYSIDARQLNSEPGPNGSGYSSDGAALPASADSANPFSSATRPAAGRQQWSGLTPLA